MSTGFEDIQVLEIDYSTSAMKQQPTQAARTWAALHSLSFHYVDETSLMHPRWVVCKTGQWAEPGPGTKMLAVQTAESLYSFNRRCVSCGLIR